MQIVGWNCWFCRSPCRTAEWPRRILESDYGHLTLMRWILSPLSGLPYVVCAVRECLTSSCRAEGPGRDALIWFQLLLGCRQCHRALSLRSSSPFYSPPSLSVTSYFLPFSFCFYPPTSLALTLVGFFVAVSIKPQQGDLHYRAQQQKRSTSIYFTLLKYTDG